MYLVLGLGLKEKYLIFCQPLVRRPINFSVRYSFSRFRSCKCHRRWDKSSLERFVHGANHRSTWIRIYSIYSKISLSLSRCIWFAINALKVVHRVINILTCETCTKEIDQVKWDNYEKSWRIDYSLVTTTTDSKYQSSSTSNK